MTLQATVLIPTYNHGPMLVGAVNSALAQTVAEIEVFIIGDGVPDITRKLIAELQQRDGRVRFFDNAKGPRHGEIYRHAALAEARGDIVCYLCDDDLYLPNHIETMRRLLSDADFAHGLPVIVAPDDTILTVTVDLLHPADRKLILSGTNLIPLTFAAHTLEMYRQLPYGWRTTPNGSFSDLYMWQQFLADPRCRAVSGTRLTALNFPSTRRTNWTTDERCIELDRWSRQLTDPVWLESFVLEVLDCVVRDRAAQFTRYRILVDYIYTNVMSIPLVGNVIRSLYRAVTGRPDR